MAKPQHNLVKHRLAYFISGHGFGHAARAASVMEAIHDIDGRIHFDVFTTVPAWFFRDSLSTSVGYHPVPVDIGMAQKTPFQADLIKTIGQLNGFLPLDPSLIDHLSRKIEGLKCDLVMCDIAPIGILAAEDAGMPSMLTENFTWDWIYQGYADLDKRINRHVDYLRSIFDAATYHVQTEPVCLYREAALTTSPVSRKPKTAGVKIREQLRIPVDKVMVLITTGGIPQDFTVVEALTGQRDVYFVIPGGSRQVERAGNLIRLPHHSDFYHPDLVNASDAVVGKLGYSTVAEVYHAGVPFGYIPRPHFPESRTLAAFVEKELPSIAVKTEEFLTGTWVSQLPNLLRLQRRRESRPNGSEEIAAFVCELLDNARPGD